MIVDEYKYHTVVEHFLTSYKLFLAKRSSEKLQIQCNTY